MADARRAAGLGTGAAVAVVALLLVPYAIADARAIGVYWGGDLVGPPLAGLFAAVAALALLGGSRGRTDPPLAAGVAVVFGTLVAALLVPWALGVSPALVGGLTDVAAFEWHRWGLAAAGLVLLGGSAWFARAVV
jgi:hypothetical protein